MRNTLKMLLWGDIMLKYFDLHCDTIAKCAHENLDLYDSSELHINIENAKSIDVYTQCFAAFIPDSVRGEKAVSHFKEIYQRFISEAEKNSSSLMVCNSSGDLYKAADSKKIAAVLTVENGAALGGKLENVRWFKEIGVKLMTLTWNAENEIGSGVGSDKDYGITDFGKSVLTEMEKYNIIADVSHASEKLFYDVAEYSNVPFIATHSNSKTICSHRRNLTDDQFKVIKDVNGLVGINFYTAFLNNNEKEASIYDILRHAEYFLSLGGEDTVAMGSDFDGAEMPSDILGINSIAEIYEMFLKHNYQESLLNKIFYGNAQKFFEDNDLL